LSEVIDIHSAFSEFFCSVLGISFLTTVYISYGHEAAFICFQHLVGFHAILCLSIAKLQRLVSGN